MKFRIQLLTDRLPLNTSFLALTRPVKHEVKFVGR